jgi:hypothetical protein
MYVSHINANPIIVELDFELRRLGKMTTKSLHKRFKYEESGYIQKKTWTFIFDTHPINEASNLFNFSHFR